MTEIIPVVVEGRMMELQSPWEEVDIGIGGHGEKTMGMLNQCGGIHLVGTIGKEDLLEVVVVVGNGGLEIEDHLVEIGEGEV
jgi:hypothetical protein